MSEFVYDKEAVGERIQMQRNALHLTQEQLAERLDKSLRFITEIERGAVGMSIETLLSICEVLKTTPNDLILPREKQQSKSDMEWLVEALSSCSEHTRKTAVEIIRTYLRSV